MRTRDKIKHERDFTIYCDVVKKCLVLYYGQTLQEAENVVDDYLKRRNDEYSPFDMHRTPATMASELVDEKPPYESLSKSSYDQQVAMYEQSKKELKAKGKI